MRNSTSSNPIPFTHLLLHLLAKQELPCPTKPKKSSSSPATSSTAKTREGLAGLSVEAWDKDLIFNDLVGSAVTDAAGMFVMI
jgi:hypothetical protein